MATQPNPFSDKFKTASQMTDAVKDSAQQIWLAGLGAFAKAQEEGGKVFDTLVKEGMSLQQKTQAAAEEKIAEATSKMSHLTGDLSSKASGQWDKLETIFEDRVAKALNKLGMPSAKDVQALIERVDALSQQIQQMQGGKPATKSRAGARKTAPKTPSPSGRGRG